jgi:hypothetical protein
LNPPREVLSHAVNKKPWKRPTQPLVIVVSVGSPYCTLNFPVIGGVSGSHTGLQSTSSSRSRLSWVPDARRVCLHQGTLICETLLVARSILIRRLA